MRFIYGTLFGVMASVLAAILYLAFADGRYLLQLSPHYHEMQSTIAGLQEAKAQRDQLADRLERLAASLDELTRRFNELREAGCGQASARPMPMPEPTEKPAEPTKPRADAHSETRAEPPAAAAPAP